MAKQFSGFDERDTNWDNFHRERGMMTNHEFFTSNGPGSFYEGMIWNGEEWVLNDEEQRKEDQRNNERNCSSCGIDKNYCDTRDYEDD